MIDQRGQLRYYASRETVIVARTSVTTRKLLRITFGLDGSIYVQFPYCVSKYGILSELPLDPNQDGPRAYSLSESGTRVETDFKFSHHTSGIAQFSKSGQVSLGPRRTSFKLDGPIGRIFLLQLHQLDGFERLAKQKKGVEYLAFDYPEKPGGILIRAEWRRKKDIEQHVVPSGAVTGPFTQVMHRITKVIDNVYYLGQPRNFPLQEHVVMISAAQVAEPSGANHPGMIFLGGWDPHEYQEGTIVKNLGTCLAFMYPAGREPTP